MRLQNHKYKKQLVQCVVAKGGLFCVELTIKCVSAVFLAKSYFSMMISILLF